jgi:hypothetical protein
MLPGMSGRAGEGMPGRVRKVANRVLRLRLWQLAVGVGALVLAGSGMFGGLRQMNGPRLRAVAPGAVYRGKPWDVTLTRAMVLDQAPLRLRRDRDRWIAVGARVEITADQSRRDLGDILQVVGVDGLDKRPPDVFLVRDKSSAGLLHPGLAEDLIFLWEQAERAAVPKSIEIQIFGKKQRIDTFSGHQDWMERAPRARVFLNVEDQRKPS